MSLCRTYTYYVEPHFAAFRIYICVPSYGLLGIDIDLFFVFRATNIHELKMHAQRRNYTAAASIIRSGKKKAMMKHDKCFCGIMLP